MEKIILRGVSVYTSDELKEKLKTIIKRHGLPESKILLLEMVDSNMLVPIINEPSKLKQLIMKIRRQKPLLNIYGLAHQGKAYIILSHDFKVSEKKLMFTALHETTHVAMQLSPAEFNKINRSLYIAFYGHYYKLFFEAKNFDQKLFIKFIDRILKTEIEYSMYASTYSNLLKSAFAEYTNLTKSAFNDRIEYLLNIAFMIWDGDSQKHYELALALLRRTYRDLFKGMDYTAGIGQELYFPSEIIAILSTINADHPNVIKSLKLVKPGKQVTLKKLTKKLVGF